MSNSTQKDFTIINIAKLLFPKWKFISTFVIIFLIVLIGLSYIIPQKYETYSSLLPSSAKGSSSGLASLMEDFGGGSMSLGSLTKGQNPKIFSDILLSRSIAKYVSDSCHLVDKLDWEPPVEKLYGLLQDRFDIVVKSNGVIFISTYTETPYFPNDEDGSEAAELVADIINTAIEGLDKINQEKTVSNARKKRILIEKILTRKKNDLDSIDIAIEEFQSENKVMSLKEQTRAILDNAITVGSALAEAEIELNLLKQEYDQNSAMVQGYEENLMKLQDQYRRTQRGGIVMDDDFSIPLNEVPQLIRVYTNMAREQKILEKVIVFLETQKYQEAIQEESDIPTVQVLDVALPPIERSAPNRKLVVIFGFLIGFFVVCVYLIIKAVVKGHLYIKQVDMAKNHYQEIVDD